MKYTIIRKILFFVLIALTLQGVSAQNGIDWSVKAGLGIGNITGNNIKSLDVKPIYELGFGLDCPLDKTWLLQTGIFFVSKGTNYMIVSMDAISAQARVNALYLELPLMAAIRLPVSRHTDVMISAGPYAGWGIGGKTKALGYRASLSRPDWDSGNIIELDTFGDEDLNLRRFDYGIGAGMAIEYHCYILGVEARLGLNKLQEELGAKNLTAFITLGYKFR